MKDTSRDILVLTGNKPMSGAAFERQVEQLHELLYHAESWDNFCIANEVININRSRIISKPHLIEKALRDKKPFVFISNKN